MKITCLAASVLLLVSAAPAGGVTLTITISNIRSAAGEVLVAVCTKQDFLKEHCAYKNHVKARAGTVTISIMGIPPGRYAAQAFQDENGNSRIDRTFLGMPKEGIGFSNDAPMHFGPPRFDNAAFTLDQQNTHITFALRYF